MQVLLLAILLSAVSIRSQAQTLTDQGSADALKGILSASRLETPDYDPSRVPSQVRVVTAKDIEASGARTLQEVLSRQPGIVLFDEVGNGYQQTVDLRGSNANPIPTTVFLVDGVKINEPDFGTVNHQTVPLSAIERIEIAPGPQTIYGKDAMSGVVNIVTKKSKAAPEASAQVEFGSFSRQRYQADVSGPLTGPLRYRLDASRQTEFGYRTSARAKIHSFDGRLDYQDDKTEGSLLYHFTDDDLHQPGSLSADEIGQNRRQNVSYVEMDSLLHSVTLNGRRKLTDDWSASANGFVRQRLENTPVNQGRTSISRSRSDQWSDGLTVQAENKRDFFGRQSIFTAGAELERDKVNSDSSGAFGAFPFITGNIVIERQTGVFAQETYDLWPELLVLTAGVRHDRDEMQNEDKTNSANNGSRIYHQASPRVGLNFNPTKRLQAFASWSNAFRSPTPNEITALGPFASAPALRPVKARNVEAGFRASFGPWGEGNVSVFRTITHDDIYPVFDPTAGFGQNHNIDKTRRDGVEVAVKPRWGQLVDGFLNYTYVESTFQTDFVLDKAPFPATQMVRSGSFLPMAPRNRLAFGASVHPAQGLTVSADELCVGSQFIFGDESNTEPRLGGYCLLGLGGSYEYGPARFFVRIDNALDRMYETRGILATNPVTFGPERFLMPAPGIMVSGGVRYRFLGKVPG